MFCKRLISAGYAQREQTQSDELEWPDGAAKNTEYFPGSGRIRHEAVAREGLGHLRVTRNDVARDQVRAAVVVKRDDLGWRRGGAVKLDRLGRGVQAFAMAGADFLFSLATAP